MSAQKWAAKEVRQIGQSQWAVAIRIFNRIEQKTFSPKMLTWIVHWILKTAKFYANSKDKIENKRHIISYQKMLFTIVFYRCTFSKN